MRSQYLFLKVRFLKCQVLIVFSLMLSMMVASATIAAEINNKPKIVVFGDSLSAAYGIAQHQGWVALLQKQLQAQQYHHQVINASLSGETTSGGLSRFSLMLNTHQPNIVILELGANDGLRGLSASDSYKNLNAMLQQAGQSKAKVLLLGMKIPPNYGLKYSAEFAENYEKLAKAHGVKLVPFFLDGVGGMPELIQADGLHPTAAAQPKLLANVWSKLQTLLKK